MRPRDQIAMQIAMAKVENEGFALGLFKEYESERAAAGIAAELPLRILWLW